MYDEWISASGWSGLYADGYKFDGYASAEQVKAKRDKTDNIAAADSAEITEWKFHCDVPEIQAALDASPVRLDYDSDREGWVFSNLPEVEGWIFTGNITIPLGEDISTFTSGTMYVESPDEINEAKITATRTKTTLTKKGEPYVTPTGVKAIAAPNLHALTPEVADTTVTLRPVDGAANHVAGKVETGGIFRVSIAPALDEESHVAYNLGPVPPEEDGGVWNYTTERVHIGGETGYDVEVEITWEMELGEISLTAKAFKDGKLLATSSGEATAIETDSDGLLRFADIYFYEYLPGTDDFGGVFDFGYIESFDEGETFTLTLYYFVRAPGTHFDVASDVESFEYDSDSGRFRLSMVRNTGDFDGYGPGYVKDMGESEWGDYRGVFIPEGTVIEVPINGQDAQGASVGTVKRPNGTGEPDWSYVEPDEYFVTVAFKAGLKFTVTVPESADATKARCFSLAVETDVGKEDAVTWQGGEVVEAFPGASKLIPGEIIWDVKEVAPGKMLVNRVPGSAQSVQSAPLPLTAPGGRVAELTVDDDLVLEVKEVE
jgi:hypothetical protein